MASFLTTVPLTSLPSLLFCSKNTPNRLLLQEICSRLLPRPVTPCLWSALLCFFLVLQILNITCLARNDELSPSLFIPLPPLSCFVFLISPITVWNYLLHILVYLLMSSHTTGMWAPWNQGPRWSMSSKHLALHPAHGTGSFHSWLIYPQSDPWSITLSHAH